MAGAPGFLRPARRFVLAEPGAADILVLARYAGTKVLTLSTMATNRKEPHSMTTEQALAMVLASVTAAVTTYAPHFIALVGLVVVDFTTGVASALKSRAFAWARVGDFYRADVGPKVLGWAGTTLGLAVVSPFLPALGEYSATVTAIGSYGLYSGAVVSLLASIVKSINEIRA